MRLEKFPLADTHAFNSFFLDYIAQKETLKPFYHRFPEISNFGHQIQDKQASFPKATRAVLSAVLTEQYKDLPLSQKVQDNILLLKEDKTFTITTGHQLNIFTGPLYFIYKIVTVINACRRLKEAYPDCHFVPVYWMASEDHDYDEIKYFRLYGEKYVWETSQTGAVGRFNTTGLAELADAVPGDASVFKQAYGNHKVLAAAVRDYVNQLFGEEGVVVIDSDHRKLKELFIPAIESDIFENLNKPIVDKTNSALEDLGYKTQVHCRDINFFYLDDGLRSRIEQSGDDYAVVDSDVRFTREQLRELVRRKPEHFSPNVILRPLYQEVILPNLAYVGGPAEVVYWLQLRQVFAQNLIPFPILMPRNFAMIINHELARKFAKTGLALKDIFEEKNLLYNQWVLNHSPRNITVGAERSSSTDLFDELAKRAEAIDKTLQPFVKAEAKRALNSLEKIERKFLRAEKRLHSDRLRQIEAVKDALFPNGSLQERSDNFLNFYQQDQQFISKLIRSFDPFDFRFLVMISGDRPS